MLGWKTVTIAHEIECYFFLSFLKKICKVQSSVFMHIVYTCICFPEQLNNNKYDVNGDCGTFVGGACFIFSPPPPLFPWVSSNSMGVWMCCSVCVCARACTCVLMRF